MQIFDDFNKTFNTHWTQVTVGGGKLSLKNSVLRIGYEGSEDDKYTDAQLDDYTTIASNEYYWKSPLIMEVRARFSHKSVVGKNLLINNQCLKGTGGFGFWNKPFSMQGRWYTFPKSVWFFYSAPPSDMQLVAGSPVFGWKAQVVNTTLLSVLVNLIPLGISVIFAKATGYTKLSRFWLQRFSGTQEVIIEEDMREWHDYTLEWKDDQVVFSVDKKKILKVPFSTKTPLGFVAWLDNEYAIATAKGKIGFGKSKIGPQWLDIDSVKIKNIQ